MAQAAGYPFNPDFNGPQQEGVRYFQLTTRKGLRCSAAVAYLNPVKSPENLFIIPHAHVQRLDLEGRRVTA